MKQRVLLPALVLASAMALMSQGQVLSYRNYQSAVKSQEDRGTCTAFAIVAAMETFDGVPNDLSEQFIYMQAKMGHYEEMGPEYDEGGSFKFYLDVLKTRGTITEEKMPYVPDAPIWDKGATSFERMKKDIQASSARDMFRLEPYSYKLHNDLITWLEGDKAKDVAWIKARLDEGVKAIPVGYGVNVRYWSAHSGTSSSKIHPGDFLAVQLGGEVLMYDDAKAKDPDLNNHILDGSVTAFFPDTSLIVKSGHAVTIVGYDDEGFLIKNSWSERWGDKGYGWVSYDYHRLFCNEALVIRSIQFTSWENNDLLPSETTKWFLKVTPYTYQNKVFGMDINGATLSLVWHGEKAPQAMKEVTYQIYDESGALIEEDLGYVSGIYNDGSKFGYPANMLDKLFSRNDGTTFYATVKCTTVTGASFTNRYAFGGVFNKEVRPR